MSKDNPKSKSIELLEKELAEKKAELELNSVRTEFQETVEKVNDLVAKALADWLKENEGKIAEDTVKLLDTAKAEIIGHMIGLRRTWQNWEVDYSFGRTSVINQVIKEKSGDAVDEWLRTQLKDIDLGKAQIKAIETEYKHIYLEKLKKAVAERAERDAEAFVDQQVLPFAIKMDSGQRKIDLKL